MNWSNYAETQILNTFRGTTATAPTKIFAAAFVGAPTEAGGGTEIAYPGYARKEATFATPADNVDAVYISNDIDINFATANQSAGSITHFAFFDAQVGGNMWAYAKVEGDTLVVEAGVAPQIKQGKLILESGGNFSKVFKARTLNLLRTVNLAGFSPAIALFDGDPQAGGAELSGTNYARVAVSFSSPAEQPSGAMQIGNSAGVSSNTATTNWGTWRYTAVMDAITAGVCVAFIKKESEQVMGETRTFAIDKMGDFLVAVD